MRKLTAAPSAPEAVEKRPLQVALLIETSNAYGRGLLRGIVSYLREHRPWSLYVAEHGRGDKPPAWLADWTGDGVIARVENAAIARALSRLKIPVVDVSAARLLPSIPWCETDDPAIARLAAGHLLERGFRHFAFCGNDAFQWSRTRQEHFEKNIRAAGFPCFTYQQGKAERDRDEGQVDHIGRWLAPLPKPLGVMACYDMRGEQVLSACRLHGIAVPDEVAVIGVDDDELLCELSTPPLSSVIPNTQRTGYEAAAILDRIMAGHEAEPTGRLFAPLGIKTRQSTDVLAIEDTKIVKAVRYIRERACEGIKVKDVLRAAPQSRRLFERAFKKLIGRTPHAEILRVQLNRVKQLLTETDLSLEGIAERTGFVHVEYLSVVFKREEGIQPSKYRAMNRSR